MAIKLKLNITGNNGGRPSSPSNPETSASSTPKLKIKPPKLKGVSKPKDKDKKLKIKLSSKPSKKTTGGLPQLSKPPVIPRVRVKPTRVPGEGYDSEAPEVEDDPLLEQGLILRFRDDPNLDFVHNAIESGDFTGINIKWVTRDKAVVNVNGTLYSARLIDLPTVTELYKTIDKKNLFKTFDICQMLLVLRKIDPAEFNLEKDFEINDEDFYHHPLYKYSTNQEIKEKTLVYKHGLTNPFEDVYRRFRPRKVNSRIMDIVDKRVDEMIKADDEAEEFSFDIVDLKKQPPKYSGHSNTPSVVSTPTSRPDLPEQLIPEDHNASEDYEGMEFDLEDELNKALDGEERADVGENLLGSMMAEAEEQAEEEAAADKEQQEQRGEDEEAEDDEEDEEEEEEEEEEEDEGPTTKSGNQHVRLLEEEINELEKIVETNRKNLATASSRMMRMKFQTAYNNLKASLDAKKHSLAKLLEEQSQLQRKSDPTRITNPPPQPQETNDDGDDEDEGDDDEEDNDDAQDDNLDDLFL